MATHFCILVWEIPYTEEPGGLQSVGLQKSRTQPSNHTHTHTPSCWPVMAATGSQAEFN